MEIISYPDQPDTPLKETVCTIGMFDGLHLGHRCLIDSLKQEAERRSAATAVVTFRDHPQNVLHKGNLKWICTLDDRIKSLSEQGIDYLILMDFKPQLASLSSSQFMAMLNKEYGMRALVVGFNHHFGHNRSDGFLQYQEQGATIGIDVVQAKEYTGELAPVSSSLIRRLIAEGEVEAANQRLYHPFCIAGIVIHGEKNGRKIGFPTANIGEYSPQIVMPQNGVYAAYASVEGGTLLPAMANIGTRPTINHSGKVSVEVNIFDFDSDIYDRPFSVYLLKRLRPENHYPSLEALKDQLIADRENTKEYLSTAKEKNFL